MKILLLYKYSNHNALIQRLLLEMNNCGLLISAVNSTDFTWFGDSPSRMWLIKSIQKITRIPKIRGLFLMFFKNKILKVISREYEIIDFHSFSVDDIGFLEFLKLKNKKIIVTFWGSDILCASDLNLKRLSMALENVSLIRAITPEIFQKLQSLNIKTRLSLCLFGVHGVDIINDLVNKNLDIDINQLPINLQKELLDNPTVVVLGNNGSKRQNHLKIIDAIMYHKNYLERSNVLLVIPLGYSVVEEYKNEINDKLKSLNIRSVVIDEYLSNGAFSTLTYLTDLYITMQVSDAFSFYLQEQLASGTIVLYGDWLPYKGLETHGVYLYDVNYENIGERLVRILENFECSKEKIIANKTIIGTISSWKYRNKEWYDSYQLVVN